MFTGIVQGTGQITKIVSKSKLAKTYWIKLPDNCIDNLQLGASVANNGCCLTIASIKQNIVSFDLIDETILKTNLNSYAIGDEINIERSIKLGDEIGGHLMSGHILETVLIKDIQIKDDNHTIFFQLPAMAKNYLFEKGFVGLDGCSLTIGQITPDTFCVHLIPETLAITNFKHKKIGDLVNLEIDSQTQIIVDTVTRVANDHLK